MSLSPSGSSFSVFSAFGSSLTSVEAEVAVVGVALEVAPGVDDVVDSLSAEEEAAVEVTAAAAAVLEAAVETCASAVCQI